MNFRKKTPAPFIRRKVYIKKDFQIRFIIRFILVLILGGIISIGLTLFNTQGTLTSSFVDSRLVIQNTSVAILPSVIYTTLITTLVVGIIVILVTLLVSHKIAGPIYRFEQDIHRIASGNLKNQIHVRNGDQFQEMATALNTMIESLNAAVSDIQQTTSEMALDPDLSDECREAADNVNQKINSRFIL